MSILDTYAIAGLAILVAMVGLWLASLALRDCSIIDVFWGAGFVACTWIYFSFTPEGYEPRKWLASALVTLWGLRLSLHILRRNWGKGEDYRYRNWRQAGGERWWWQSLFKVFLLQGALLWLISSPLLAAQALPGKGSLSWLDALGVTIWLVGFIFEAGGDWQLTRFQADPANQGKLLTTGLWRYSRHPNYFGDAAQWWGFYLFAAAAGGYWALYSPLLMTWLLMRVSGVALLEKNLVNTRPGYAEYMQTTNAFIPWLPHRKSKDNVMKRGEQL
jgi:steroid 5-alpha reductase family enzyme